MNAFRAAGFGIAGLGFFAVAALAFAPPSAAGEINISGNWTVSSFLTYTDSVINVTNTTETDGFVTIDPAGILLLQNSTLILPYNRTLDVQGSLFAFNSTLDGPRWFFWIRGRTWLDGANVQNATHDLGGGFSGTYLVNSSSQMRAVRWTQSNGEGAQIHLRVPFNFTDNYLGAAIGLSVEFPGLSASRTMDIARNRFDEDGATNDAITFETQTHVALVTFDIHDNNFTGGDDAIRIHEASASTRFLIHDNTFASVGEAVNANDADFHGFYDFRNLTVSGCTWAFYLRGFQGDGIKATLENISITSCAIGVIAHDTDIFVRNSSIDQTNPAYNGYFNGHIFIYDTVDQALSTLINGNGGSVEHFTILNLASMTWQGNVPFVGQNVTLQNATGVLALTVNPLTWTPRYIVWWGSYYQAPNVDNRDLHPVVLDGTHVYGCSPSQFFVTRPMAPVNVVCTDDESPRITLSTAPGVRYQNSSTIQTSGSAVDNGSGLSLIEWSFDNSSWGPVTPTGGPPGSFTISSQSKPDGPYTVYFRARDRVGLTTYVSRGPFIVDTVQPPVDFDTFPPLASGTHFDVTGTSEPFVPVDLLTAGGLRFNTATDASGRFTVRIPLVEGLNLFFVTATDYAGNGFMRSSSILVDNVPPVITVFNAQAGFTETNSVTVSGLTETGATVVVNGLAATRSGDGFSRVVPLIHGLNPIMVNATDGAGNVAQWFGSVVSDDDLPVLAASFASENVTAAGLPLTRSSRASVSGRATDATTAIATLLVGGSPAQPDGTGAFTWAVDLVEGENSFTVTAVDAVGNTQSLTLRIVRDSLAPSIASTAIEAGDGTLVDLDGTPYTDGDTVELIVVLSEDAQILVNGQATDGVQGTNRITLNVAEGANAFSLSARDRAGNTALPTPIQVMRDRTAPMLSFSAPANGAVVSENAVTVTGLTESGASLQVNGVAVAVGPTGGFSVRVELDVGANTIRAVAQDPLGNAKNATITVARSEPAPAVANPESGLPAVPLLIVGLVAGAAAGFILGNRRTGGPRTEAPKTRMEEEEVPHTSAAPPARPPARPPAAPPAPPPQRGPRGPRPPGP